MNTNDILIQGQTLEWKTWDSGSALPSDGLEYDDKHIVAKSKDTGDTWNLNLIGTLYEVNNKAKCRFSRYKPEDFATLNNCLYLVKPDNFEDYFQWVKTENGVIPDGAVTEGEIVGKKLYIVHINVPTDHGTANMATFLTEGDREACSFRGSSQGLVCRTTMNFLVYSDESGM